MEASQIQARVKRIEAIEKSLRVALAELGRLLAELRDESDQVVTASARMTITPMLPGTGAKDVAGIGTKIAQ